MRTLLLILILLLSACTDSSPVAPHDATVDAVDVSADSIADLHDVNASDAGLDAQ